GLISQALMCYNIYLILSIEEEGVFNTLKSLNNLVEVKNNNAANPNLKISNDDEFFNTIDLVLTNKIALNKNYETGNKINISLTKQNHALIEQLKDFEGGGGFWDTKYVPLFKWISENNLFNDFIYALCYSIENEAYAKIIKQNEKEIISFVSLFNEKWPNLLKYDKINLDGEEQKVKYHYSSTYIQAIGKMENDLPIGHWTFYYSNGRLKSEGFYNEQGKKENKWTWFHKNNLIKETAIYVDDELNGENLHFHENGKPYVVCSLKNGEFDGEYKYYNV